MSLETHIEITAKEIVDCAFHIHKDLGAGLLESVYEKILYRSLEKRGLNVKAQVEVPINYEGEKYDSAFRADLIVNDCVLIELKACEQILPIHRAQTLTYIKLSNLKLGLLINFNVPLIKNGIIRIINDNNFKKL